MNQDKLMNNVEKGMVSVIIPTYKRATTLLDAVSSVLSQTYKNIEIIIVDDNGKGTHNQLETEKLLKQYIEKSEAIGAALSLFSWDNETLTPKNSMEKTSKIVGILSSEYFDTVTNKEVEELLEQLKEDKTLTKMEQLVVSRFAEDVESLKVIPQEDFATYSELRSKAGSIWADARANNDFQSFESVLKEIIEYNKKFIIIILSN